MSSYRFLKEMRIENARTWGEKMHNADIDAVLAEYWWFWAKVVFWTVIATSLVVLAVKPASAQSEQTINWRSIRQKQWVCRDWGGCGYEYRWRRVRTYTYPNHTYRLPEVEIHGYRAAREEERWERRDPSSEKGVFCKEAVVRVVGGAHLTKEGATNDAVRQWQSTVRYDFGEKFMDVENARGYHWRCDRASTNESLAGKIGEALTSGQGYQRRCVVQARPCMRPVQAGDRDEK